MAKETKSAGDKTLSLSSTKTLTLKPRSETGIVRTSFSHGRSKAVVVEKVKRRIFGVEFAAAEKKAATEEAERRILEARRTGSDKLVLAGLRALTSLPDQWYYDLDKLRILNLSGTAIRYLYLGSLPRIESLDISDTPVDDIKFINSLKSLRVLNADKSNISDISPLRNLNRLENVRLNDTRVSDLAALRWSRELRTLGLSETRVSNLTPISTLPALQSLNLQGAPVSNLRPLAGLTTLQNLDLRSTKVDDLRPLASMRNLKRLSLSSTNVSDLSPLAGLLSLIEGAKSNPQTRGLDFLGCPLSDKSLQALADRVNPERTIEVIQYLDRQENEKEQNRKKRQSEEIPSGEIIPNQLPSALSFTSATRGPLSIQPDPVEVVTDPEQAELYGRMREQLSSLLEQIPSQERGQVTRQIDEFLRQPSKWAEIKFKKILWLCGNSLRNILSQHDVVVSDPDPHYAKLPPIVAETLRQPVETWNIVILGDATLRDLDAQRLGPRERQAAVDQLRAATPILTAAAQDRRITTSEAGAALEASVAAASNSTDNIHTRQAQELARGTSQNLVVTILRGAHRTAQDLQNPQSEEAKQFAREYKSGMYKKLGEWTITGSIAVGVGVVGATYFYSLPFFEFVVTHGPWLKAYLAVAFENEQLVRIVDLIAKLRERLTESVKNGP